MQNNKLFIKIALILFVFSFVIVLPASAKEQVVEVTGRSYVEDGDLAGAYELALDNGLVRAVEQAVGTFIDAETITENMVLIENNILRSTRGYVKEYNVLEENLEDNNYFLELEVTVSTADLSDDLKALELNIKRSGNPRLAIIMEQRVERYNLRNQMVGTEMRSKFLEAGYLLVDMDEVEKSLTADKRRAIINGDYTLAAEIGSRLEADIIVVGSAEAYYTNIGNQFSDGFGSGLISYDTEIRAEAISTSSGQIIAANTASGRAVNITRGAAARESLLVGAENISKLMIDDIGKNIIEADKTITLQVSGLESIAKIDQLEAALGVLSDVKRVYFREYAGGLASFDLDIKNNARLLNLAVSLEEELDFSFKVNSISDNRLSLIVEN